MKPGQHLFTGFPLQRPKCELQTSDPLPILAATSPPGRPGTHSTGSFPAASFLFLFLFLNFYLFIYLFIYLWLCWVFVSVRGLSLVAASGGHSSLRCAGLSLSRPLLLRSTGSRRAGSVVVAHGPSRSAACGIFLVQGSNLCPLHWQADSQPLRHQGSPAASFLNFTPHSSFLTSSSEQVGSNGKK